MKLELEAKSFWAGVGIITVVLLYGSVMYTAGQNAAQVTRCEVR